MKHTHIMFLSRSLGKCHAKDEGAAALVPPKAAIKVLKPFMRMCTRVKEAEETYRSVIRLNVRRTKENKINIKWKPSKVVGIARERT